VTADFCLRSELDYDYTFVAKITDEFDNTFEMDMVELEVPDDLVRKNGRKCKFGAVDDMWHMM